LLFVLQLGRVLSRGRISAVKERDLGRFFPLQRHTEPQVEQPAGLSSAADKSSSTAVTRSTRLSPFVLVAATAAAATLAVLAVRAIKARR